MKSKKTKSKVKSFGKKKILVVVGIASLVVFGLYWIQARTSYYNFAADQATMAQTRDVIIAAVNGLKKDAPVEPKTGDIYFPEGRLYVPNPKDQSKLTYAWLPAEGDNQEELSVSLAQVPGTHDLYTALDMTELFDSVPKLQACSRGVKLVYKKFPMNDDQNELKRTITLNNGKKLYMYLEKDCPDLDETVDLLKNIKAY